MSKKQKVYLGLVHGKATVSIDGVDISQKVKAVDIRLQAGLFPTLIVEYDCIDQLVIEGEAEVVHVCPKSARV